MRRPSCSAGSRSSSPPIPKRCAASRPPAPPSPNRSAATTSVFDEAQRALEKGDLAIARTALEAVIAEGGDRDQAATLLDRIDDAGRPARSRDRAAPRDVDREPRRPRPSAVSWSRRAFAAAATIVLVVLGASVFSSWDRLLFGLTRPPAPRADTAAAEPAPAAGGGDRALAEARRLIDAGDAAAALAALDRVGPQEAGLPVRAPAPPAGRSARSRGEPAARPASGSRP